MATASTSTTAPADVPATKASATASAATDKRRPARPNQEKHDAEVLEVRNEIAELQQKMKEIQDQIPDKGTNDSVSTLKSELREKLNSQLQDIKDFAAKRSKILDQLAALQSALKKKFEAEKAEKGKIRFKTVEEVDARIDELEMEIQTGQAKLFDEKRMVSEISNLKKVRKVLEGHSQQQSTTDSDKAAIDTLRTELKSLDSGRAALREAADATRAKLTKVTDTLNESRGSISELLEKKKANKILVDAAFEKIRELRAKFKTSKDEFYAWDQEERLKRHEGFKQRQTEEREARIVAMAERELEDADIPAFAEEINLCNALIQFLGSQAGSFDAKTLTATTPLSSRPATASIRTVDKSLPSGVTVMQRKSECDDDFMVLGKKGKKNGKNNKSVAAASTTSATTPNDSTKARPVKMDILTVNQLIALHIAIPVSTDDIPAAVALLTEKKEAFLSEQAAQTAANKQAAQARITQLRETAKTEDTEL
ncbi:hypothetical protein BASA60_006891 [Batrachochytrium salamandrivorans]|nr:hypothetical protein BASA60_006891 [Batrachochytrium salamandrivorans]